MKKLFILFSIFIMILGLYNFSYATTDYKDLVDTNEKYVYAVKALTELDVIDGFPDGTFKPDNKLTRAQMAKMITICMGLRDSAEAVSARTVFSDVDSNYWGSGYINVANQVKIIIGYPDKTFKSEKEVTYAEAVTMVIRALGYGNVVDTEGSWPTSYMLKAVELGLIEGIEDISSNVAATRGNTAILLWNMLRTPMWRIASESEGNGMTKTTSEDFMLNVKFPDYNYIEDGYITDISVEDYENVTITVDNVSAKIKNVDLSKLIIGQKVSVLIKESKKDNTFVIFMPVNSIVAGFATDKEVNQKTGVVSFKVNEVEYKMDEDVLDITPNDYLVFEVEGKKITQYKDDYVIKTLPIESVYVDTLSKVKNKINEDDLVIKDGVWTDINGIEIGDVYTQIDNYYIASSKTIEDTFEVLYTNSIKWSGDKVDVKYLSVGGKDYRLADINLVAREGEDNKDTVSLTELSKKVRDNNYSDEDVIVFLNYLDIPARLHFGKINISDAGNDFYAITSNGAWSTNSSKGKTYNIDVVDAEGEEYTLATKLNINLPDVLTSNHDYYNNNSGDKALFAYIELDDDEIQNLVLLHDGIIVGDKKNYNIVAVKADSRIDGKKIVAENNNEYNMTSSTIIFEAKADKNDNDEIEGFNVEVSKNYTEYDNTILPEGTLIALDVKNKIKFVFITSEAQSNEIFYSIVERGSNFSKDNIILNNKDYTISNQSISYRIDDIVKYTITDNKVKVKEIFEINTLDDKDLSIVKEIDKEDNLVILYSGDAITLDEDDADFKDHKKYNVFIFTLDTDKNNNIEVTEIGLSENKGYKALSNLNENDRILINDTEETILVFTRIRQR